MDFLFNEDRNLTTTTTEKHLTAFDIKIKVLKKNSRLMYRYAHTHRLYEFTQEFPTDMEENVNKNNNKKNVVTPQRRGKIESSTSSG